MKSNITNGIYIRVQGEDGKTQAIPWEVLKKMGDHLQNLVHNLAKYNSETVSNADKESFTIELFDFKPGSAVPAFRLRKATQISLFNPDDQAFVAKELDEILKLNAENKFNKLNERIKDEALREEIAKDLYGFTNASPHSPVAIVKPTKDHKFRKVYDVPKVKASTYQAVLNHSNKVPQYQVSKQREEIVAKISFAAKGIKKAKVEQLYGKNSEVGYSPKEITSSKKSYVLHSPLSSRQYMEDKYYVIENDLMDLYATGETIDEAEINFNEEFDHKYQRLNELKDNELSERLIRAKTYLNLIVKEIIKLD
jgi:hypothetical protein